MPTAYPTSESRSAPAAPTQPDLSRPRGSGAKRSFSFSLRVRQKHLTLFTRQFAILLNAGLPIVRAISILQCQLKPGALRDAVSCVKEDIESGCSLSEGLSRQPHAFDKLYINMIRAGEMGGVLDEILARLADYREKAQRLQQKITGALVYPAAVVTVAAGILSFIMIFIIPRFEVMFKEMNLGDLPVCTQLLMAITHAMVDWWFVLIFTPLLIYAAYRFAVSTTSGRLWIDRLKLHVPVFGQIVSKSAVSRFCRTLGTLVQSGVPILDALKIIHGATGNQVIANAVDAVHASIKEGDTIADPLRHCGVFDELVVNMIQVGEETGELDKMLIKVADTYDGEVDTLVGALMSLLEPFLIVGMGIAVGFIVISLFMPLIKVIEGLS